MIGHFGASYKPSSDWHEGAGETGEVFHEYMLEKMLSHLLPIL